MMTHVKKNAQRATYTKPSHIECAVQFRNIAIFPTTNFNCENYKENSLSYRKRDREMTGVNEYIQEMEKMHYGFLRAGVF